METDNVQHGGHERPLGPLNISETTIVEDDTNNNECPCILCELRFVLPSEDTAMLTHFYVAHRLVIADVHLIPDLKSYVKFWKESFKGYDLAEFCTTMLLDQTPDGSYSKNEKYFLLSDVLPKDYELRTKLQQIKYQEVLDLYQMERTSTDFSKECLFCRQIISGTRILFITHLFDKHNLYLGKHSNLVYIEDMIKLLQSKIEQFICIYCEKIFKDRVTLKEHMRKKNHKRVNPKNKAFDKFYLINYNYFQKQNKSLNNKISAHVEIAAKSDTEQDHNSDSDDPDWCDWEGKSPDIICLFCKHKETEFNIILDHMKQYHNFNFEQVDDLEFYKKVKIVNYIRRKMYLHECVTCEKKFDNSDQQQAHMKSENHIRIPDKQFWDHPEYFFPTFEDDNFLCHLDNDWNDCLSENVRELNQLRTED